MKPYFTGWGNATGETNFGQQGFNYTPPTGYKALCSANLSEPTIKNGTDYFDTVLFTGNGSNQIIDCGFTTGSRYVMIKRTDSTGNWKQYDTERGLHFMASVNCNANDYTAQADDDFLQANNAGFKVNSSDAEVNASGGNYIYLAVANDPT